MFYKLNYDLILKFLTLAFPFLLISGPLLSDLACIILGLIFIIYNIKKKNWAVFFDDYKKYIYFFALFYIYLNVNSLFSFDPKISFFKSATFIRIIFFIFAIAFFFEKFKNLYGIFYLSFFICINILLVDSILIYLFGFNILGNEIETSNRISSLFGDELIMGSYISRLMPIALGCSFLVEYKKKYFLNLIILLISGILVALSGERVAAFYYLGTIFIYFLLIKKYFFKFVISFVLILVLGLFNNLNVIDRFYHNTINQFKETNSYFSYRHTLHYITAYEMFLDKKILGHGLKSFRYKCNDEKYVKSIKLKQEKDQKLDKNFYTFQFNNGCNTHPHNIFLEYLSELGLVGVLFFISIYFYILFKFARLYFQNLFYKKNNNIIFAKIIILGGVLLQLFPLIPSGSFFNNYMLIIVNLSLGFYLSLINKNDA